jgi:hypothetical protein
MLGSVFAGALLKSSMVMSMFSLLRTYVDPMYSHPQCALRCVNETDPIAYSKHPYWKDLVYDETCAGDNLQRWIDHQTLGNQIDERYLTDCVLTFFNYVVAPVMILYGLYQIFTASKNSFLKMGKKTAFSLVIGIIGSTILLMHTHFNVDIIYLTGGIHHHAVADAPAINFKANTITEGYVLCGTFNRIFYNFCLYFLMKSSPRITSVLSPELMIGLMQITMYLTISQVGQMHPVYHKMSENGSTPAMDNALPYTHEWRAYKHCITHHDNGYSFSGDLFLDPLWDFFLDGIAMMHNQVLKIPFGTPQHYAFSMVADALMGTMGIGLLFTLSYGLGLVFGSNESKSSSGKQKSA